MWKIALNPKWILFHALVLGATYTCLRLGFWQWEVRWQGVASDETPTLSVQNTFYAFQWWFFAGFFLWFWFKFFKDEKKVQDKQKLDQAAN
jgi:hypothetical protein